MNVLEAMRTLDSLRPGMRCRVSGIIGSGSIQQRLLEMGVSDGADVEVLRYAPLGDPMEIFVRGFFLTLRKSEAALVEVEEAG
jgi:Fe2+ transport system protein FeoA